MRLLPRTTRGTLTLAAAAWLAGAALLWGLLPPRPRATYALPPDTHVSQSCPGTNRLIFGRFRTLGIGGYVGGPLGVFDVASGRVVREFPDAGGGVYPYGLSPDGRQLALVQLPADDSGFQRLRVFDVATGAELHGTSAPNVAGRFYHITPLGDGRTVAYEDKEISFASTLHFWDYRDGREVVSVPIALAPPLAASANGSRLAAVPQLREPPKYSARIVTWDTRDPQAHRVWDVPHRVVSLQLSANGTVLVAELHPSDFGHDQYIAGWDAATGRELFHFPNSWHAYVTPDGGAVIAHELDADGADAGVFRWDVARRAYDFRFARIDEHVPDAVHVSRREYYLPGGLLGVRCVQAERPRFPFGPSLARWINVPWLGQTVVEDKLIFYDGRTGQPRGRFTLSKYAWFDVLGPDSFVTSSPERQTVYVWDVPPRKPLTLFLALAALLALPVAGLAAGRLRRLRRVAAQ